MKELHATFYRENIMEMQKVKGTITRLLTGLLLPVFLVLVLLNVITLFTDTKNAAGFLLMSTVFGYMFMAIPSLIYTLLMEFAINRRVDNDYRVWIIGAVLGASLIPEMERRGYRLD